MHVLEQMNYILTKRQKKKGILVVFISMIGSLLEMLGIALLMPFMQMLLTPEALKEYGIIRWICALFNIDTDVKLIVLFSIVLIFAYVVKNAYLIWMTYYNYTYATRFRIELSTRMMNSYLHRNYSFHLKNNSSILYRGVGYDVDGTYAILNELFRIIAEFLTLLAVGIMLFFSDPVMASVVMGLVTLCVVWFFFGFRKLLKKAGVENSRSQAMVSQSALQAFQGIKDIMVMQKAKAFENLFHEAVVINADTARKKNVMDQVPAKLFEAVCVGGIIGAVCIMALYGADMKILVPRLAVFAVAAFRVIPSAGRISGSMNTIMYYRKTLEHTYQNLKEINNCREVEVNEEGNGEKEVSTVLHKAVYVKKVFWKYENTDKYVLQDLNLTIEKGKSVALIGASGAGKTTLADVILGLLKPESGSVYADEMNIFTHKKIWAKMVGYVPQTVFMTDDTIRNNVAFGEIGPIDDEKVWNALEQAQMKEFVENLSQGLDTMIGERGVRFSGGQRQRLAISRALYHNPDILILDEATSALDNATESAVMEAIELLQGVKTLIIVAHRLSTIVNCDEIYKIENGVAIRQDRDAIHREVERMSARTQPNE